MEKNYQEQMKKVKAVAPYTYKNVCNFKSYPYLAWKELGLPIARSVYPPRFLHSLVYKCELPCFRQNKEARLRFVSGYSILFDTFPDYALYEVIPLIWDCWPRNVPMVEKFFTKHNVKTAIFTSSQTADLFRIKYPEMNILTITEGVKVELYHKGKELKDRSIDILEVGRAWVNFFKTPLPKSIKHIKTGNMSRAFKTDEEFRKGIADAKVTINVPRCDVDKKTAGDIETLTQRYWECMLSRVVMVGRAPRELVDLIGYDPVISFKNNTNVCDVDATEQVNDILSNIEDYQILVDKNYETAIKMAPWSLRVNQIVEFLKNNDYSV